MSWDFNQKYNRGSAQGQPVGISLYLSLCHIRWRVAVVQWLSHVRLFAIPWTAAHQTPLSFTISLSLLKLMSIQSVMPSNHLILCCPLLFLPSIFPSIRGRKGKRKESPLLCARWVRALNVCSPTRAGGHLGSWLSEGTEVSPAGGARLILLPSEMPSWERGRVIKHTLKFFTWIHWFP